MSSKEVVWKDGEGYPRLSLVFENDKPEAGLPLSVDLSAYGLPPSVANYMWQRGFITPRDYKQKMGIYRVFLSALVLANREFSRLEAHMLINQIRKDYE